MAATVQAVKTDGPVAKPLLVVMATMLGTYPDPGSVKALSRAPGDKFVLSDEKHFSRIWMRRLKDGEDATVPLPVRNIPQTTAPVLKRASPFPPQP